MADRQNWAGMETSWDQNRQDHVETTDHRLKDQKQSRQRKEDSDPTKKQNVTRKIKALE
jgi:hypothetical protein